MNNNNDDDDNISVQASSHLEGGKNSEGMEVSPCEEYYREQDDEEKAVVILLFAMGLVLGYDDLMKRIRRVGRIKIRKKHVLKVAQKRYELLGREQQTRCFRPSSAWSVDQLKRWMHANPITGQNNIDFVRSTMESTDFGLNPPFVVVIPASSNEQHSDANNDEPQQEEEEKRGEGSDNAAQESFMGLAVLPSNENDNGDETNRESHQGEEQDGDANNDEPQEEEEGEKKEEGSDNTAQESFMAVAVLPANEKDNRYETNRESHQGEEQDGDANNDEPQQQEEEEKKEEGSDNTTPEPLLEVAVLPSNENDNGYETNRESHTKVSILGHSDCPTVGTYSKTNP